jgi:Secretion system C-terminal sorting domain
MQTFNIKTILFIITLLIISVSAAKSQVTTYNSFGPGNQGWDYSYNFGWTLAGYNVPSQYGIEQAMGFQSKEDCVVTDIWIAISSIPSDTRPDTINVRLARNFNRVPPDTSEIMERWTITNIGSWSQWNAPNHLVGNGKSRLQAGQSYWLWAVPNKNTLCIWCMNINPAFTCPHTLRRVGEQWLPISYETASAFRLDCMPISNVSLPNTAVSHDYSLGQNYPNPFNTSTIISFNIPSKSFVTLKVYDSLGRLVASLVSEELSPGDYSRQWNAGDSSSSIYYYQIHADNFSDTKKMLLLK